ncbi:bacillithiol biosynthesis deacetylase BshB1 [Balneolaceae bacterium ANBcel3]|nr:bacillithiol biosynthesis deacetylase BshB1 [Balneolaceae bacterium ANBcel3]
MKIDILAIGAHPDDVELSCGGTLAAMAQQGKKTGILDLTCGEMSTRGTPQTRLDEAKEAADILGLTIRENAGLPDCGLENSMTQRKPVIRAIRTCQPDICFIPPLSDRHPDHQNAARLVIDALFYAGLSKLETSTESGKKQQPWRPAHIIHFMQHWPFQPTFVFDITETLHIKEKAILAYRSQFNAEPGNGPETYISGKTFFDSIRARAREYGQQSGLTYGEPFLYYGAPIPVQSLDQFLQARVKR